MPSGVIVWLGSGGLVWAGLDYLSGEDIRADGGFLFTGEVDRRTPETARGGWFFTGAATVVD